MHTNPVAAPQNSTDQPSALIKAQVLAVYWMHDQRAGEQGYGLLYRAGADVTEVTLLADERSENDPPLYIGDWITLRQVGERRHCIAANLTRLRDAAAPRVDWVRIAFERDLISPAPLPALATPPEPAQAKPTEQQRDEHYAEKYPDVAAWLAQHQQPVTHTARVPDWVLREQTTNGGW